MRVFERETNDEYSLDSFDGCQELCVNKVGEPLNDGIKLRHPEVFFHYNTITVWGLKNINPNHFPTQYESTHFEFYTRKQRRKK